jgi:hypothetical protein
MNVRWTDFDSLPFILHFFNHFCSASGLVCTFCDAMPGSLSVVNTAVHSANVADACSVQVCRFAVHSKYNDGL